MLGRGAGIIVVVGLGLIVGLILAAVAGSLLVHRLRKAMAAKGAHAPRASILWSFFFPFHIVLLLIAGGLGYAWTLQLRHVDFGSVALFGDASPARLNYDPEGYDAAGHVIYAPWLSGYPPPSQPSSAIRLFGSSGQIVFGQWKKSGAHFLWDTRTKQIAAYPSQQAFEQAAAQQGIPQHALKLEDGKAAYEQHRKRWVDLLTLAGELALILLYARFYFSRRRRLISR